MKIEIELTEQDLEILKSIANGFASHLTIGERTRLAAAGPIYIDPAIAIDDLTPNGRALAEKLAAGENADAHN